MTRVLRRNIKERWKHILFGFLGKAALKLIGLTCRFHIEGIEQFIAKASEKRCILMFWHNRLTMVAEILFRFAPHFKYAALISNSKDGEIIATLVSSYKNGRAIRVPHNARSQALQTLVKEMQKSKDIVIITPDGPKGPAYTIKPGIAFAAKKANAEIFPLSWRSSRYWTLPTWDKMLLPKPFSKIFITVGSPLSLNAKEGAKAKDSIKALESALCSLERDKI